MSKVYVTQETNHDFSPAEEYGEVVFLTKDDFNNMKNSLVNEALMSQLSIKLRKFDSDNDWLVMAGSPYVSAAVFLLMGQKHIRRVRVLRWDNRDFVYRPMEIDTRINDVN